MHLIAFRLFPVGQALVSDDAIVANDATWRIALKKNPGLPVKWLINMIGNPAHAEEYGRLIGIAFDMLDAAQEQGLPIQSTSIDFDAMLARIARAGKDRVTGQVSLF